MNLSRQNEKQAFIPQQITKLRKRIFFLKIIVLFLVAALAWVSFVLVKDMYPAPPVGESLKLNAPLAEEIQEIIQPLSYSGIANFLKPDVKISLDFAKGTWRFHNLHRFDSNGNVILSEGRYGLCGDLAVHVYSKIKPLLGNRYQIDFLHVAESGYFLAPQSSHIALLITENSLVSAREFILDPTFHRYAGIDDFDDYLFFERMKFLPFWLTKETDEDFPTGTGAPLVIKNDFLIGLQVDEQNGRFDKENFILTLTATRRYKFSGRFILALRRKNGHEDILENHHLARSLLTAEEYSKLRQKIFKLFEEITFPEGKPK